MTTATVVEVLVSLGEQTREFLPDLCEYAQFVIASREEAEQIVREKSLYGDEGTIRRLVLLDPGDGGLPIWCPDHSAEPETIYVDKGEQS